MLDNGAFSVWRRGRAADWAKYYRWAEPWLSFPTTWAIIPDVIDGGEARQDALIAEWPFGDRGAPVWHMDEPIPRLLSLADSWPKVCVGSTAEFAVVMSPSWERRIDECWNALSARHRFLPAVHMLRGMACSGKRWPFASVDSTDIARNHNRQNNSPKAMAERWDSMQAPGAWALASEQLELL
jgi:hypothetical protein